MIQRGQQLPVSRMRRAASGKSDSPGFISVCFLNAACKNGAIQCHVFTTTRVRFQRSHERFMAHFMLSPVDELGCNRRRDSAIAQQSVSSQLRCSGRMATARKLARKRSVLVICALSFDLLRKRTHCHRIKTRHRNHFLQRIDHHHIRDYCHPRVVPELTILPIPIMNAIFKEHGPVVDEVLA